MSYESNISVLLIEDDEVDQMSFLRFQRENNILWNTDTATSATEAKEKLRSNSYHIVLTDYDLGDGTALDIIEYIGKTPFIFLTGQRNQEVAVDAMKAGAFDYVIKDVNRNYLNAIPTTVRRALENEAAKQKLKLLESVVVYANDSVLITEGSPIDLPGPRILYINEGFTRMTGYTLEEIKGKSPRILQGPKTNRESLDKVRLALTKGEPIRIELLNYSKQREEYWVDVQMVPLKDAQGTTTNFISIQRDITEQKKAQEELVIAKEKAERAQAAERMFLAYMSHEIKNPIHAVAGLANLLADSELRPDQQELADSIFYSSTLLSSLVGDLLDLSKIEADEINFQEEDIDLYKLFEILRKNFSFGLQQKPIRVHYELPDDLPLFRGDLTRLNQIMINLLGNAGKFTEAGEIFFSANPLKKEAGQYLMEFEVRDTGIGIAAEDLPSIFDRFKQSRTSLSQRIKGTGLGLAIIKQLIELQGGDIRVESEEGQGSVFIFTLTLKTLQKQATEKTNIATDENVSLDDFNILVAEDNPMNQKLIELLLKRRSAQFTIVPNGVEALELLEQEPFDLLLTDINMPQMDGYQLSKALRAGTSGNAGIPIVALTASTQIYDKETTEEAGIDEILAKPFTPSDFNELINRYYHRAQAQKTVIDLSFIKDSASEDAHFIKEMLDIFIQTTPESLQRLQQSAQKENKVQLALELHSLSSNFKTVGGRASMKLLTQLEKQCHVPSPDWNTIRGLVVECNTQGQKAVEEAQKLLATL